MPKKSTSDMESGIIMVETKVGTLLIWRADNRSAAADQSSAGTARRDTTKSRMSGTA